MVFNKYGILCWLFKSCHNFFSSEKIYFQIKAETWVIAQYTAIKYIYNYKNIKIKKAEANSPNNDY